MFFALFTVSIHGFSSWERKQHENLTAHTVFLFPRREKAEGPYKSLATTVVIHDD